MVTVLKRSLGVFTVSPLFLLGISGVAMSGKVVSAIPDISQVPLTTVLSGEATHYSANSYLETSSNFVIKENGQAWFRPDGTIILNKGFDAYSGSHVQIGKDDLIPEMVSTFPQDSGYISPSNGNVLITYQYTDDSGVYRVKLLDADGTDITSTTHYNV